MARERLSTECVVIGAGLSGLSAATVLHQAAVDVVVLEARDRVGGRAWTVRLDEGTVLDLGGQWIGASHHRLMRLGDLHGATSFRQHSRGDSIIRVRGRNVRSRGKIPLGLGPATLAATGLATLTLDRMARAVSPREPWSATKAADWDTQTLETWIRRHVHTPAARAVVGGALTGILSADPGEVSLLHALAYIRAGEGLDMLTGTVGAAQNASFTNGAQDLAERVARQLDGRVRLQQPVRAIRHREDGVSIETDDLAVDAQRAIVAIPPTLAGRIDYSPALPSLRDQLTQRVPQGSVIKCFGVYDTPFWRDHGLSGLVLDTDGPISMIIEGSGDAARNGVLIGFFEGTNARQAARLTDAERRDRVLDCFARHFGARARSPGEYRDQNWCAEPFTRGCYTAVFPPGAWTGYGSALREPIGPIHWAGTETASEWMGYFEGALEAGERAAREVLASHD